MTDFPAIFSGPIVLGLLARRKRMTRRLAWRPGGPPGSPRFYYGKPTIWQSVKPGDLLWVRENFWRWGRWVGEEKGGNPTHRFEPESGGGWPDVLYACETNTPEDAGAQRGKFGQAEPAWHLRPCIFLERRHSRLTLEVVATKIEPVTAITEADAIAEGAVQLDAKTWGFPGTGCESFNGGPVGAFSSLWMSLHGIASWEEGPEVVAVTFVVHGRNIDAMEKAA